MSLPATKKERTLVTILGICYQEEMSQNELKNGHTLVFMFMFTRPLTLEN